MSQIYNMESPIDTARPQTVWDSHMSIIMLVHPITGREGRKEKGGRDGRGGRPVSVCNV